MPEQKTAAERELEHAKHNQDLAEVQRAAEAARESDWQRTEHERQVNTRHEALIEESKRAHFLNRENCQ
jgi:hypothetical protein